MLQSRQTFSIDDIVTEEVVNEYWERGYWTSPKLFDEEQIAALRAAHERLWAGDYDVYLPSQYGIAQVDPASPRVRQQINAFWLNKEIRKGVTDPLIGAIAARLMKTSGVYLWHDQAIYKPGTGTGEATTEGNIGWHQDYGYWQASSTTNMCTAWVALQDTDLSNGGMRTIVGSHKWGLIPESDTFGDSDLSRLAQRFSENGQREWLDEPCILKAGEVSFHHALTFHGSGPNTSSQPRLSIIAHMMPAGTTYRLGQQWHPNVVFLGPDPVDGQPFVGPYWPQIWPVEAT